MLKFESITDEAIKVWCTGKFGDYTFSRLAEIIRGEYSLDEARADILSFHRKDIEE